MEGKMKKKTIRTWVKQVKHRVWDMHIQNKFIAAFISILVILVGAILVLSHQILYQSNIQKAQAIAEDDNEIIAVRLDTMKENLITCSNMLAADINRIYDETNIADLDDISFVTIKNNIYTVLDYDKRCFKDIHSILFVDGSQNISYVGLPREPDVKRIQEELISQIPSKGMARSVQFPVAVRTYFSEQEPVLTIGKRIIDMDTGKIIGHIFINVKESRISSVFPEDEEDKLGRSFFLLNEEMQIMAALDKTLLFQNIEIKADDKNLISEKRVENLNWILVSKTSISEVTRDIRTTSKVIIGLGILGIVGAIIIVTILTRLIIKPVHGLTEAAIKAQGGDFSVNYQTTAKDEVGILAKAFQEMILKIKSLLLRVEEEQKKKREYELALLQEQIKPHFLYNTLDLIYVFCERDMSAEAAKITKSLADFYRTSLSNGEEIVTIREEMQTISNYLYIQRERYFDLLDFEVHCDENIEDYPILRLLLQPLVENAIYHGIKDTGTKGVVRVCGYADDEAVVLIVEDDGAGMTADKIAELKERRGDEPKEHFGIHSIRERLALYYAERASLTINSQVQRGTKIVIKIYQGGGDNDKSIDC